MLNKKELKQLKESGKLKEFCKTVVERLISEGSEEKLARFKDFLRKQRNPYSKVDTGKETPLDLDLDPGAFSTEQPGDYTPEEDPMDLDVLRQKYAPAKVSEPEDLPFELDSKLDAGVFDPYSEEDYNDTVVTGRPSPAIATDDEEVTKPGIKRGRRELGPDSFRTMEELDNMERQDLKGRREMRESVYRVYGDEMIEVEASNLQDAAVQANDSLGEEYWEYISDENETEILTADDYYNSMDSYDYNSDEEFGFDKEAATFDTEDDYVYSESDDYDSEEIFEGFYNKRLRDGVALWEVQEKQTLDDWGKYWSDRKDKKN